MEFRQVIINVIETKSKFQVAKEKRDGVIVYIINLIKITHLL